MDSYQNETMTDESNVPLRLPKRKNTAKVIVLAAVFGLLAGAVYAGTDHAVEKWKEQKKLKQAQSESGNTQIARDPESYTGVSKLVENVKPAIVAITATSQKVSYDIFHRPYVSEAVGAGSGFIIGQSGEELLIATNNHVIEDAADILIHFVDDSTATATIKGAESSSDLAVVSVNINDLSDKTIDVIRIATLGSSENCQQGELVVAIGNALGYGQSTTVGYVSAVNREVKVEGEKLNLIQTDAAINPGNSGGALLNSKGEVIGINSVKYVKTTVEGVGYAIPISDAVPILNDLMNRQVLAEHQKAEFGAYGQEVTEAEAKMLNIPIGIYVNRVTDNSPAAKAGIKVRDIITGVNGRTLKSGDELEEFLDHTKAGTKVTFQISVNENGDYVEKDIDVTLGSRR